jgi:hypothetical protein
MRRCRVNLAERALFRLESCSASTAPWAWAEEITSISIVLRSGRRRQNAVENYVLNVFIRPQAFKPKGKDKVKVWRKTDKRILEQ